MLRFTRSRILPVLLLALISSPVLAVTVTPAAVTLQENSTQQFTASVASAWSTTCGTVSSTGLFKAPLYPKLCTITATATDGTGSATASVNVVSPISMTPVTANTPQGQTQQFTASAPVTWVAACGTITAGGLYTASAAVGTYCTIEGIATTSPKYTVYGYDKIGSPSTATFSISPLNPTVTEGATQQFTAGSNATWTTNCGTISSTGLFKAPLYPKVCAITAIATSDGQSASTNPNVVSPIVITPVSVVTPQGQTQQFTASAPVTWVATCGTITAAGLFTATAAVGKYCSIEGIATGSPKYAVYGTDKIGPPSTPTLSIAPLNPALVQGATQQFTASRSASFAATCGSISPSGLYTASVSGSCTVTATAQDGSGQTASTTATVSAALAISPADSAVFALGKQQFSANLPATWSSTCGNIDANTGLFTAPPIATGCTVTAASASGPPSSAAANVNVSIINYTRFRGNAGTGTQAQERVLTPANVNSSSFGLSWSMQLDAGIWSQPLYMNALNVNGAPHNVVLETTANDSVYAIDADAGTLLWQRSFLSPGVTAVAGSSIGSSMNPVGIVGTPVIDPDDSTMYVVTMTAENNNTAFIHRLHAIDITTGQELPNSPAAFQRRALLTSRKCSARLCCSPIAMSTWPTAVSQIGCLIRVLSFLLMPPL